MKRLNVRKASEKSPETESPQSYLFLNLCGHREIQSHLYNKISIRSVERRLCELDLKR